MALHCKRLAEVCLTIQGHSCSVPVLTSILNIKKFWQWVRTVLFWKKKQQQARGQYKRNWRTEFL